MNQEKQSDSEEIIELLTNYFGKQDPKDFEKGQISFEVIAVYFLFLDEPVKRVQRLLSLFDQFKFSRPASRRILNHGAVAFVHKQSNPKLSIKMLDSEVKIKNELSQLIQHLEKLENQLRDLPPPLYLTRIDAAQSLKETISNQLNIFKKIFKFPNEHRDAWIRHLTREKPSGQKKAYPESFRKKVVDIREEIANELGNQSHVHKPWQFEGEESGDRVKGWRKEASGKTLEILRCFEIDMKTAGNILKLDYRT